MGHVETPIRRTSISPFRKKHDRVKFTPITKQKGKILLKYNGFVKSKLWCLLIVIFLAMPTKATELTRAFLNGVHNYKTEDYEAAVVEFSKIVDAGIRNGNLFYNLGNAYLKNGDVGYAMLWYERALKLIPDDPDLKFNHKYGLTLVKDEREDNRLPILRVVFFWQHLLSATTIQWAAVILNMSFWLILVQQVLRRKRTLKTLGYVILTLALVFTLTAFYNHYASRYVKEAVILPDKVAVRSGLTDDSTELFVLHAGTKVKIEKENKDFYRIYFSEGKIGWLKQPEVGVI